MFNDEYRHTSLIATLRKSWNLGEAFTQRDASARTFDDLFTLDEPRDPQTWATVTALPVPAWHLDEEALAKGLSGLGKTMGQGIIEHARELGVELPPQLDDPDAEITPRSSSTSSETSPGTTSPSSHRKVRAPCRDKCRRPAERRSVKGVSPTPEGLTGEHRGKVGALGERCVGQRSCLTPLITRPPGLEVATGWPYELQPELLRDF